MGGLDVHFSSQTAEWGTPQDFFDKLHAIYDFDLDPAASDLNHKCPVYYTEKDDGLSRDWHKVSQSAVYLNPPYGDPEWPCKKNAAGHYTCAKKRCMPQSATNPKGRGYHIDSYTPGIIDWVRKAHEEAQLGAMVVALLPARTDTEWFHEYIYRRYPFMLLKGRLKFESPDGVKNSAPFPSMLVIFTKSALTTTTDLGMIAQ